MEVGLECGEETGVVGLVVLIMGMGEVGKLVRVVVERGRKFT